MPSALCGGPGKCLATRVPPVSSHKPATDHGPRLLFETALLPCSAQRHAQIRVPAPGAKRDAQRTDKQAPQMVAKAAVSIVKLQRTPARRRAFRRWEWRKKLTPLDLGYGVP